MAGIPDSVRHKFQRIIETSKADERFRKIMANGKDDNFMWAYEFAYERAYGKAPQSIDVRSEDVTPRPQRERLDAALRSVNGHSAGNGVVKAE